MSSNLCCIVVKVINKIKNSVISAGELMNRHISTLAVLGLTLSACSSVDNRRAAGDFEYADRVEAKAIVVPEHLKTPKQEKKYAISDKINVKGPIGVEVDVRAPSLALPVAASSRIEPNTETATIWFDKVLEDKDLKTFIVSAVEAQLASDNVDSTVVDSDKNILESGWYLNQKETGMWMFETLETVDKLRFRFQVSPKPHGRSASLSVELAGYENVAAPEVDIDVIDKQRAEMKMLNEVVAQVDYQYRLVQRENRLLKASQKLLSIGENSVGEPAYIVEMDLDSLWQNLPIFFEDYGFNIADLNETKKIYYVDFVKPDNSLWASSWGDETPVIDVADARYQFVLEAREEATVLTIYNADGDVISHETLERIFPVMEPGLSFRNVF